MRLDLYLYENGFCGSRTEAKSFVVNGNVTVNGKTVSKPSYDVLGEEQIEVDRSSKKYVSRGGLKLEAAIDAFKIDVSGLCAIDIGASSGGFTDCLLKHGAEHVIALDSGTMQLSQILRDDARVTVLENFNARYMSPSDFEYVPEIAVMDVSFISATLIIPAVANILLPGGGFVCLIKPQFEVGRAGVGKGGIVKNDALRRQAVDKVLGSAEASGFENVGLIDSPILGGDGNAEFLAYFLKKRYK